jgi:chloride channel protein, CIC family
MAEKDGVLGRICWQLLVPAAIGALTGACVAAASALVEGVALAKLASLPGALPALFSPAALLLTLIVARYVTRAEKPATSELYILTYHRPETVFPLHQVPGRLLGAATTVGFGGSQGFESASALIGVTWSELVSRWRLGSSVETRRSLLAAGASAGIAAVFSSPSVGTLYGIEVPFKRDVDAPRLAPCAVAAVASYAMRDSLVGAKRLVEVRGLPEIDLVFLGGCLAVAIACGAGAWLFAWLESVLKSLGSRQTRFQRAALAGVALAGLAWCGWALCGKWITFGPGYVAADWLLQGGHPVSLLAVALAIRASGNLVCVYGGGGGGVFTSLACNGAFLGQIVAELIGRAETRMLPLLGAACFLGAGYRLPIACMLLVAEESRDIAITAAGLIAIAIGQVLMASRSVSEAQIDTRRGAEV